MSAALEVEIESSLRAAGVSSDDFAAEARAFVEAARGAGSDEGLAGRARALAAQRIAGRPLAYIVGHTRFLGLELEAAPGALVPRAETELLARAAIDELAAGGGARAVDMCCGSGNLACAIAAHAPDVHVWASDLTDGSIAVARRNIERLGLTERVTLRQGDLFAPLRAMGLEDAIDVIACNPPYISTGRLSKDRAGLLQHEPREAFDGGPYGLTIHQRVIGDGAQFLRPGGWLMFEVGEGQHRQVSLLFGRSVGYEEPETRCDGGQQPRVVMARKKPNGPP